MQCCNVATLQLIKKHSEIYSFSKKCSFMKRKWVVIFMKDYISNFKVHTNTQTFSSMHRVLRATYPIANIIWYFSKFVKNHFGRKFKKFFRALKMPEFNSKCFADAKYNFLLKWLNYNKSYLNFNLNPSWLLFNLLLCDSN